MKARTKITGYAMVFASFALAGLPARATPSQAACRARANDTPAKLVECIQQESLWQHLAVFQRIANEHPDQQGHGNRDIGTPGYKASVQYVAGLMRQAGYKVTIQAYQYNDFAIVGTPAFGAAGRTYGAWQDWFVARLSGSGDVSAPVQPVGAGGGCAAEDFAGFARGRVALVARGACVFDTVVANAEAAGAAAVVIYNSAPGPGAQGRGAHRNGAAFEAHLTHIARIPVVGVASHDLGDALLRQYRAGAAPAVHLDIRTHVNQSSTDYNLIADSPFGDPNRVVVVDGHLDSIYGAGMLDNASGSTTILEIALQMAKTKTVNQLRYIWFGGEEVGLLGSAYYTTHLSKQELDRIVFDIDVDVTATPNFDVLVADPSKASNVGQFPPNVVPRSRVGNKDFASYFKSAGIASQPASFGNDGTDSNSFSLVGVPNSGILTQQDCCKQKWEVRVWGGFLGDYEGQVPGVGGECVDYPDRWCDNLSNNDRFVLGFVSKGVAYVTHKLANDASLRRGG